MLPWALSDGKRYHTLTPEEPRALLQDIPVYLLDFSADTASGNDSFFIIIRGLLDFSDDTIARYRDELLLMPAAATPAEGLRMFEKGVHFIKVITPYGATINSLTAAPSFNFAPLLVTGGMNLETIPAMVARKIPLIASGFEVVANGRADALSSSELSQKLREYRNITLESRENAIPGITAALAESRLNDLPWALPVNWEM